MYEIIWSARAYRDLKKLPPDVAGRILNQVDSLALNPRPPGAIKLTVGDEYRLRCSDYRTIYSVQDGVRKVIIEHIGHRADVYGRRYR
ncbi:MAG: type II toxin-antitoxin system RelE/ParE family toxin [Desulforudis sp.]|nr:MAG: type II toxin-antitoxin system RelE/ParE family toxin [Desulforudis sp.]